MNRLNLLTCSSLLILPISMWAESASVHLTGDMDWTAAENGTADGTEITSDQEYHVLYLKGTGTVTGPLTITSGGFALQRSGCVDAEADLGAVLTAGSVAIGSRFYFGGREAEVDCALQKYVLGSNFTMAFVGELSADRDHGYLKVQNSDVRVNGGSVSVQNFRLRTGTWTQSAGKTVTAVTATIGRGSAENYTENRQELEVDGGRFEFRRMAVGLGNTRNRPARLTVGGGVMESLYDGTEFLGKDSYAAGLDLAPQALANEFNFDGQGSLNNLSMESPYCAADVLVSGGTLKTPRISFGGNGSQYGVSWISDTRSSVRFRVTGGTLNLGGANLELGSRWNAEEVKECRYLAEFSGGTVTTFETSAAQNVEVRLAEDHGGVTYDIPAGATYQVNAPMYGPGGFTKAGTGMMVLTGSNEYTGTTTVAEGELYLYPKGLSPRAVFDALKLELSEGDDVLSWSTGVWSFTSALGAAICGSASAPKMGNINGQAAVAFDGTAALGMTGSVDTPISGKPEFTVGFVFCTDKDWTGGGSSANWTECAYLAGQNFHNNTNLKNFRGWGVSIDADGHVLAGTSFRYNNAQPYAPYTVKNDLVQVNDGRPHVVYYAWSNGTNHTLYVDGQVVRGSDEHDDWTNGVNRTRFTIGCTDDTTNKKFFKGKIAMVSFFTKALSGADIEASSRMLTAFYAAEGEQSEPTASAADEVGCPAATYTLVADDLAAPVGNAVTQWGVFKSETAQNVFVSDNAGKTSTAPTLTATGFNGHKAVSFDGVSQALACGQADVPAPRFNVGDGKASTEPFTIAAVIRLNGVFSRNYLPGSTSVRYWCDEYQFFGTTKNGNFPDTEEYLWGLCSTGTGELLAGVSTYRGGSPNLRGNLGYSTSVGSENRWLVDDRAHVVVMTMPPRNAGSGVISLTVDGVRTEVAAPLTNAVHGICKTFAVLGGSPFSLTNRYVGCAISEMRFWNASELSAGQIRTLTRELCAKYGADFRGDERLGVEGQRSAVVDVAEGACYGNACPYWTSALFAGQTLRGAGTVKGRFVLKRGAAIELGATTPSFEALKFEDGAILKVTDASGAPLAVPGGTTLAQGGRIALDLGEMGTVQNLNREVLALGASGISADDFTVVPSSLSGKVKLTVANGVLRCKRMTGVVLVIR